jgi:hypothetical protein
MLTKHEYKVLMSNLRATRNAGQNFTIKSYPVWGSTYKWEWARFLAYNVLGWEI